MLQRGKNPFNVPTLSAMNSVCSSRHSNPQGTTTSRTAIPTIPSSPQPSPSPQAISAQPIPSYTIIFPVAFCRKNPLCQTLSCDITGKSSVTLCHANSAPATSAYLSVSALAAQAAFSHLCLVAFFPRPLQNIYRFRA